MNSYCERIDDVFGWASLLPIPLPDMEDVEGQRMSKVKGNPLESLEK